MDRIFPPDRQSYLGCTVSWLAEESPNSRTVYLFCVNDIHKLENMNKSFFVTQFLLKGKDMRYDDYNPMQHVSPERKKKWYN